MSIVIHKDHFRFENYGVLVFYSPELGLIIRSNNESKIDLLKDGDFIEESINKIIKHFNK